MSTIAAVAMLGSQGVVLFAMPDVSDTPMFRALGMIESGDNDYAAGLAGERSRYQIKRSTWIGYSNSKWHWRNYEAKDKAVQVAENYMNWLGNQFFKDTGKYPNVYEYYAMWNLGYGKFKSEYELNFDKLPPKVKDNCQRYYNLYHKYQMKN